MSTNDPMFEKHRIFFAHQGMVKTRTCFFFVNYWPNYLNVTMKKLFLPFFVLSILSLTGYTQTLEEQLKKGDELYESGQYQQGIEVYEKALSGKNSTKDSTYVKILNQLAWAYVDEQAYRKAEPLFIEAKNIREKLLGKENKDYALSCSFLSLLYYYQGAYSKAEPLCIEAKNIREKAVGKKHSSYANSCFNLADIYNAQRLYAKAEPFYLEAKEIYETLQGKEGVDYRRVCSTLANLYYDQGLYNKAEFFYIEVKNNIEKTVGKEDIVYARAIFNLAVLYLDKAQLTKAEALMVEAKKIFAKAVGTSDPGYANVCNSLANVYFELGLYQKSEALYIEAKNIFEKSIGKENAEYASACNNLGALYKEQRLFMKAEALYLEAKKIQEKVLGKEDREYAISCNNLASIYAALGLYEKARALFLEAKAIHEKRYGKEHPEYALSINNLGNLYLNLGAYAEAEALYTEAKNIRARVFGKEHPEYAGSCNSLANLFTDQGLYSKAEPLYLEAKNIYEKALGKENPKYATACNNLANLYFEQKLYARAEPLYLEAKAIQEKKLGKLHTDYAMSCNNLGSVYLMQLQYAKAEPMYVEAKNIQGEVLGKYHPDYAMSCGNLGSFYRRKGQPDKAEALYIESRNIYAESLGKESDFYANSCNNLANLYTENNRLDKSGPLYKEAVENKLKQIREVLPALSEKERDEFYKSINFYFKRYYEYVILAKQPTLYGDLFDLQLQIKGLIFQSTQKMQRQIMNSGNDGMIRKYENWKAQRVALNYYMQLPKSERAQKKINTDSLTEAVNALEKSLSLESEIFAASVKIPKYNWQSVQKRLFPNEAAVEIIRTDSAYLLLIVTPTTKDNPEAVLLSNGKELEKRMIVYYRTCIAHKIDDQSSYTNFWLPIREKLGNASKVYVSGDGVYHQLNLLTLKNPSTNAFLFNETNIQLVSNLKDLLTVPASELPQQYEQYKIHLVAYPKYDVGVVDTKKGGTNIHESLKSDTAQRFYDRGGKIQMLAGTKTEAANIATLCNQLNLKTEVKLLDEASEAYLKSLRNPGILHIATHGFFLAESEVTKNSRSLNSEEYQTTRDPLLNSGLLLANAQQGMSGQFIEGEDGVLTAKEALHLNLDKTSLVVMSACETGLGEIRNGEGVYGLQRSFQQAGAKTIINSLWKVSDEATQELMSSFYQNLLSKKMNKREAFRMAQTELMKKYPEPYYWGAFVMIGE